MPHKNSFPNELVHGRVQQHFPSSTGYPKQIGFSLKRKAQIEWGGGEGGGAGGENVPDVHN